MKRCLYCGRENANDARNCRECGAEFERPSEAPPPEATPSPCGRERPEYEIAPLPTGDRHKNLVTLVNCRTLMAADMVVARLRAEGIIAYLPDESLMQAIGWNFNTYGYVRVQVAPGDYDAARDLLADLAA